jgi:hypothetical protein
VPTTKAATRKSPQHTANQATIERGNSISQSSAGRQHTSIFERPTRVGQQRRSHGNTQSYAASQNATSIRLFQDRRRKSKILTAPTRPRGVRSFIPNDGSLARPKRFELLTPRFVVQARALKSLGSVIARKPLRDQIGFNRPFRQRSLVDRLGVGVATLFEVESRHASTVHCHSDAHHRQWCR